MTLKSRQWVLHRVVDRSGCAAPLGEAKITDLDFADDIVNFVELVDGLVRALEGLSEKVEPWDTASPG